MRGIPFLYSGFVGGLNTIDSPFTLEDTESRDCLNVVATTRGAIRKRYGSTQFVVSPPAVEITSVAPVTISGTKFLVAVGGTSVYSISASGTIANITGGATVTAGSRWSIVQAPVGTGETGGPVYLSNGIDPPLYWAGSGNVAAWTGLTGVFTATINTGATDNLTAIPASVIGWLTIGMTVTGASIPGSTEISSIDLVNSAVTLSNAPTSAGSETITVAPSPFYATSPGIPNGSFMVFFGNRIWMTGVAGDPSAVYFSDIVAKGASGGSGDPTSFPLTNVVRFDSSDGYPVTGISTVGAYLLVFKEFKAWVITDINTGANRALSHGVGCVAHRSIVPTADGTFFLSSNEGIFVTNGTTVTELSYKIRPTIFNINQSLRANACGTFFGNHYYLSFASGTGTANNRTLDYDLQLKAWFLHDLAPNQWCVFEPAGTPALFGAIPGASNGVALCFDASTYQDRGANYTGANGFSAYWFGAWQRFYEYFMRHRIQMPMVKKRVRQVYFSGSGVITPVVFKNFSISGGTQLPGVVNNGPQSSPMLPVTFSANNQVFGNTDTTQVFGGATYEGQQMIFGGAASTQDARVYALGVGEEWCVGFGDTGSNNGFEVDAYAYAIQMRKS